MLRFDPTRRDLTPYGFSCKRWAPAIMRRPDRHNEIELNFLPQGWITYLFGGRLMRLDSNRLTAFWAAVPHQIIAHGGLSDYFVLTIPLGWFLRLRLPERFVQALVHGQMVVPAAAEPGIIEQSRLTDWEKDFESPDPMDHHAAHIEIEAQLRRLSTHCPEFNLPVPALPKRPGVMHDGGLAKAEQMAHLVANRYNESIDAATFAREVNLHPKHAMRLFHQVFGTSLASFITEYRIAQAQRLLVSSSLRIVDISETSGFGSLSRFNRAFRQVCGCSPREYRSRHALRR